MPDDTISQKKKEEILKQSAQPIKTASVTPQPSEFEIAQAGIVKSFKERTSVKPNERIDFNEDGTVTVTAPGGVPQVLSKEQYDSLVKSQEGNIPFGATGGEEAQRNATVLALEQQQKTNLARGGPAPDLMEFERTEVTDPIDATLADAKRGTFIQTIPGGKAALATIGAQGVAGLLAKAGAAKAATAVGATGAAATGGAVIPLIAAGAIILTAAGLYKSISATYKAEHVEDVTEANALMRAATGKGASTIYSEVRRGGMPPEQGELLQLYINEELMYAERVLQMKTQQGDFVDEVTRTGSRITLGKINAYRTKYGLFIDNAIREAKAGVIDPNAPDIIFDLETAEGI